MKILIIINSFRLGGAEKLCYDLALRLSKEENIKVFLYSIGKIETDLEQKMHSVFSNTNVSTGSFNKPYRKERLKTILKINSFCREKGIDLVHTNGQSPDFLARATKFLGNKAKIVVTIHSTSGYSEKIESLFSRVTDIYTTVSEDALDYAVKSLKIRNRVINVNNGIDIEQYSSIEKKRGDFSILSVGRVTPEKDYVKAACFLAPFLQKHKAARWIIFGDYEYDKNYFSDVYKECEKLGIAESVKFMGVCIDPKEIYQHGNVFLLASRYEGFGIAFIEAIMSGHFIFSKNVGVLQEISRNGGIIHNIDDENSIQILEKIYENDYSDIEIKENKKIVAKLYSVDSMVEKYINIYEMTLKNE